MKKSEQYLNQFEEQLRCAFSSEATIKNYLCCVRAFFGFASECFETDPSVVLRRYIVSRLQGKEAKTVNLHRAAIVKFFKLVKNIEIDTISVPRRKEPKKLPRVIPGDIIQKAIEKTFNIKHRLIISLFYSCGIRLCEMLGLRKKNILVARNVLWLEDTKGDKHRIVPIPASIRTMLYEFIKDMVSEQVVFGNICKRTFEKIVANAFVRIGERASPHMLRHGFATDQITSGQNIGKVQAWLGHSNIKTTMIYVHLSEAQLSQSTDLLKGNYTNQMGV